MELEYRFKSITVLIDLVIWSVICSSLFCNGRYDLDSFLCNLHDADLDYQIFFNQFKLRELRMNG